MKISRLVLMVLMSVLFVACSSADLGIPQLPTSLPAMQSRPQVQFAYTVSKTNFKLGEPVELSYTLTNLSDKDVMYNVHIAQNGFFRTGTLGATLSPGMRAKDTLKMTPTEGVHLFVIIVNTDAEVVPTNTGSLYITVVK